MSAVRLYRIGSDPEFVFAKIQEWSHTVVPANQVISNNKAITTQSFIGTDGHAATAELRPPPMHNVRAQILNIASAMRAIDTFLAEGTKWGGVKLVAAPVIQGEMLGGHIHVSFFNDDPDYTTLLDLDANYTSALVGAAYDKPVKKLVPPELLATIQGKVKQNLLPTPHLATHVLNYLLLPLEYWMQPWISRVDRNSKYGGAHYDHQVRWHKGIRPKGMARFDKHAYLHYEYRAPSTWLAHPWLAYLYFAFTKLSMRNWDLILSKTKGAKKHDLELWSMGGASEPGNAAARALLVKRLEGLQPDLVWTEDLQDIPRALEYADSAREEWVNPFTGVHVKAWKEWIA